MARHYQQSKPGACLPACVRMVLEALGASYTEAQIARQLGSYEFGTPASRVERLIHWGFQVNYGPATLEELRETLQQGQFPIVFVRADILPWANFGGFHALVLAKVEKDQVRVHDPALPTGPTPLALPTFLLAWEEFDRLTAFIT